MRILLVLAIVAFTQAAFRPGTVSKFREKNEEKIKKAILEMESGNSSTSSESGERSDLAGTKRDPDDSIQKKAAAAAAYAKMQEEQDKFEQLRFKHLEIDLKNEMMAARREGEIINAGREDHEKYRMLGVELERDIKDGRKRGEAINGARENFDYLMFTMIYPTATCMADDDQAPGSCKIPAGTAQWTIHGLWPNFKDGSYPQFCDPSKFDEKQVEQIHDQMRSKWPNLFPKTPENQLWSHEWEKHGTCSKTDPLLNSQFKYFNMSLFLLDHIDLRTRMEQKGISPRSAPYERDTLQKTLDEVIGHHVQMFCLQDKKSHESLLADVRVCMDASLKPMDCPQADIHPYVRAGTVTPNDHQPLPVPKRCAESIYYVAEGTDISKSIEVLAPEDAAKKGNKTDEDYYDDDEIIRNRNEFEDLKARKLEEELMKALTIKTEEYQENLRKHEQFVNQKNHEISMNKDDVTDSQHYARVMEMAKQFQESRVRGVWKDMEEAARAESPSGLTPFRHYFIIFSLCIYLIVIIAFFCSRSSGTQRYGRLQPS